MAKQHRIQKANDMRAEPGRRSCGVGYALLFAGLFLALYFSNQTALFSWAIVAVNVLWLLLGRPLVYPLLASCLIPNEFATIASLAMSALLARRKGSVEAARGNGINRVNLILLLVILANSAIRSAYLGSVANLIASCAYYGFFALLALRIKGLSDPKELFSAIALFVVVESVASLAQSAVVGFAPGDGHCGTLDSAHHLGVFCSLALIYIIYHARSSSAGKGKLTLLVLLDLLALYMSDAKATLLVGFSCVVLFLAVSAVSKSKRPIFTTICTFSLVLVTGAVALGIPSVENALCDSENPSAGFFSELVYDNSIISVNKLQYMSGTFSDMASSGKAILGYGLGEYGSRFANLFGYEHTYRPPSALNSFVSGNFESHMIPEYRRYASLYTEYVVSQIQWHSAVLTYPFSSFVALLAETGLVGLALFLRLLYTSRLSVSSQALVAFFFGAAVMDTYLDHAQLLGMIVILLVVAQRSELSPEKPR